LIAGFIIALDYIDRCVVDHLAITKLKWFL